MLWDVRGARGVELERSILTVEVRSPHARHKPVRSIAVARVFCAKPLEEHGFFDVDAMHERQGRERGKPKTAPVAEHSPGAQEHPDCGRIERVANAPIRAGLNNDMVGVDRERVAVESPKV